MLIRRKYAEFGVALGVALVVSLAVSTLASAHDGDEAPMIVESHESIELPRFDRVADAEAFAGMKIGQPAVVPARFQPEGVFVVDRSDLNAPNAVIQFWSEHDSESGMSLLQDERLDGISGGEPTTVGGNPASFVVADTADELGFDLVELFWRDGSGAYLLTASLTASTTVDAVRAIAESVAVQ